MDFLQSYNLGIIEFRCIPSKEINANLSTFSSRNDVCITSTSVICRETPINTFVTSDYSSAFSIVLPQVSFDLEQYRKSD